jgi:hypothetical protein
MKLPNSSSEYIKSITNPFKYWLMIGLKLPSVLFWGIKLIKLDDDECIVNIPFRFTTQNPFKSIYFAALNGAAELSTGLPVQMVLCDKGPSSMLVTGFEAQFIKKASTHTRFICKDIQKLRTVMANVNPANPTAVVTLETIGYNLTNEEVCRMKVHWSIKCKY